MAGGYDLKDEGDVKEYIENLGIEYRFGCYHEKNPKACHLLGDYLEAIKREWEKAGKVYQVNCDDYKWGHSCFKFGNYLFLGRGNNKVDHEKAADYYDRGCDLKFPEACLNAAMLRMSNSSNIEKNDKNNKIALNLLKNGCELDNALSCFYTSGMFISGIKDVLEKDMKTAFQFSLKACQLGNVYACANVSQMYRKGDGVEQNIGKADEYKKMAIDMSEINNIKFGEGG